MEGRNEKTMKRKKEKCEILRKERLPEGERDRETSKGNKKERSKQRNKQRIKKERSKQRKKQRIKKKEKSEENITNFNTIEEIRRKKLILCETRA